LIQWIKSTGERPRPMAEGGAVVNTGRVQNSGDKTNAPRPAHSLAPRGAGCLLLTQAVNSHSLVGACRMLGHPYDVKAYLTVS